MGKSRRRRLNAEIASLVDTLLALEENDTQPKRSVSDHAKRIPTLMPKELFATLPESFHHPCFPIHQLLSVAPLTNTEIPLDIFEVLIGAFDVKFNELNDEGTLLLTMNTIMQ